MRVPSTEALWMLSTDTGSGSVWSTKHNRNVNSTGRHIESLGSRVDDMIDGLHWEVEGHELTDWTKTSHGSAGSDSRESHFSDWCVDDSLVSVLLPQSARNLKRKSFGYLVLGSSVSRNKSYCQWWRSTIWFDHFDCITRRNRCEKVTETCRLPRELTL